MKLSRLWRPLTLGAAFVFALEACAASVMITGATQRWPWNGKVDIAYAVSDGQDVSSAKYRKLVFTVVIGDKTYMIDGSSIGASAADGPHTVMWTAPDGVKPTIYRTTIEIFAGGWGDTHNATFLHKGFEWVGSHIFLVH